VFFVTQILEKKLNVYNLNEITSPLKQGKLLIFGKKKNSIFYAVAILFVYF
jgi:hypothetical protein